MCFQRQVYCTYPMNSRVFAVLEGLRLLNYRFSRRPYVTI